MRLPSSSSRVIDNLLMLLHKKTMYMKRLKEWMPASLMLLAALAFAACSDDDKEAVEPLAPIFDKPLALSSADGATETIEFNAGCEWSLSSDAIWCTLSSDGVTFAHDIMSTDPEATVYVKVGGEAQQFTASVATLTMMRRGVKETIATVRRAPMAYELRVVTAGGEECRSIALSSTGVIEFAVEANFDFGVSEKPRWIDEFTVTTDEDNARRRTFRLSVEESFEALPCKDIITFFNSDSTATFPYEIGYSGMSPKRIKIEGENPWGWSLSADAALFSTVNAMTGDSVCYSHSVPYRVTTLNYDCRYLCFDEGEDNTLTLMSPEDSWLSVSVDADDASQVSISGAPFPAETEGQRKGYVVALPAATYDSIMALYRGLGDVSFIDAVYNNVMLEVTQVSDYVDTSTGFTVMQGMVTELDCFEESDPAFLSMLKEKFSLEKVYATQADAGVYLQIFPHLTERHWEAWSKEATIILDAEGNELSWEAVGLEIAMDAEDNYYISLKSLAQPIVLVLRGVDGKYLKALVIKSDITLDPGTGFDILYMMIQTVSCSLETDMELAAYIIERFGTKEIYTVRSRVGRVLQVFPHLTEEQWKGATIESICIIDTEGNDIPLKDVSYEVAMNDEDVYYASVKVKKTPYIVVFISPEGKGIKALVVRPQ